MLVAVSQYGAALSTSCHTWPCPHAFTQPPGTLSALLRAQPTSYHNTAAQAFSPNCYTVLAAQFYLHTDLCSYLHMQPCRESSWTFHVWKELQSDLFREGSLTGKTITCLVERSVTVLPVWGLWSCSSAGAATFFIYSNVSLCLLQQTSAKPALR